MRSFRLVASSALAIASALPLTALAQGTITYFQPAQSIPVAYNPFVFPPVFYDFDVDGDGSTDYRFNLTDSFGVSVEPVGNNRQIALPAIPPDMGSYLDPLPPGFQIGSSLAPTYYWVDMNSPNWAGHSFISSCLDFNGNYVCSGLFQGQNAYMGIEFLIGGQPHSGWVHINNPGGTAGGYILEWAYETRPGVPIIAGAKPVPVPLASPQVVRPGYLRLTWLSEIGKAYQVQSKARLDAFAWTNLGFVIPATSTNSMIDLPISGVTQFFRVVEAD